MMRSRIAQRIADRATADRSRRVSGQAQGPAQWLASRSAALTIINWSELPDDETDGNLQNADGEFLFLAGYSALDGGDVLG